MKYDHRFCQDSYAVTRLIVCGRRSFGYGEGSDVDQAGYTVESTLHALRPRFEGCNGECSVRVLTGGGVVGGVRRPSSLNDVIDESLRDFRGRRLVLRGSTDTVRSDLHEDGWSGRTEGNQGFKVIKTWKQSAKIEILA